MGYWEKNGRGFFQKHEKVINIGTLGKAFGSTGAFVVGSRELKDYLINTCRSFIFTTAPSPCIGRCGKCSNKTYYEKIIP